MSRPTILVVDDDTTFLESVAFALRPTTNVLCASSVYAGEETLRSTVVDAIVTDYRMNSGDGHEFVAIAKKLKPSPPVILVTAYADKDLAIRSANLRVFAFLEKPVDFSALTQAVGSAIEEKRREARNTSFESSKHSLEEDILLDANDFSVHFQGKKIVLTKVEFQILNVLIKSAGERISRSEITQRVWGRTKTSSNLLDSHLRNMRAKLPFLSERLKPIWGAGYIFLSRSDEN